MTASLFTIVGGRAYQRGRLQLWCESSPDLRWNCVNEQRIGIALTFRDSSHNLSTLNTDIFARTVVPDRIEQFEGSMFAGWPATGYPLFSFRLGFIFSHNAMLHLDKLQTMEEGKRAEDTRKAGSTFVRFGLRLWEDERLWGFSLWSLTSFRGVLNYGEEIQAR
jgi:hypothetical protein